MTSNDLPELWLRHEGGTGQGNVRTHEGADATCATSTSTNDAPIGANPGSTTQVVWPYCVDDGQPLAWWRMLPPHMFGDEERALVQASLTGLAVIDGEQHLTKALEGDSAAAIAVTLSLVPIAAVTLKTEIAMTALLCCALRGDGAAVLVLSHILGRGARWGGPLVVELGTAWLDRHIATPLDPAQFAKNEAALAVTFGKGEDHEDPEFF